MANTIQDTRMAKLATCNAFGFTTMASLLPQVKPGQAGGLLKRAFNMQDKMGARMQKQASRFQKVRELITARVKAAAAA